MLGIVNMKWVSVFLTSLMAVAGSSASVGKTPIEALKDTCSTCHSRQNNTNDSQGPQLGGFSKKYISTQMYNFKEGHRGVGSPQADIMVSVASVLSAEDIEQLADWASSNDKKQTLNIKAGPENQGAALFNEHCKGCHSSFIGRMITKSPRLDYLQADYIEQQLTLFANKQRTMKEPNKHQVRMQAITTSLTTDQIRQIVAFLRDAEQATQ